MASSFGGWAESLSAWQKNNPMTAKVAGAGAVAAGVGVGGVLTYNLVSGLMSGFGLSASAVALDGSAAALTAAAAALGGGGVVNDAAGAGKTSRKMPFVPFLTATTLPLVLGGDVAENQKRLLADSVAAQTAKWQRGRDFTLGSNGTFGTNFGSPSSFVPLSPRGFAGDKAVPSAFNYREASIRVETSGQVNGEATLTIKIDAPDVIKAFYDAKSIMKLHGAISSNGPGSAGLSSPDAGAASAGLAGP
jgi:hypothetical protein